MEEKDIASVLDAWSSLSPGARNLRTQLRGGEPITEVTDELNELLDVGLAQYNEIAGVHVATDLRAAEQAYIAAQRNQIQTSLNELARMAKVIADLETEQAGGSDNGVRRFAHHSEATASVQHYGKSARSQISTSHPIPRSAELVARALPFDLERLQRGIALRVIYLDSARTRPAEQEYATRATAYGAQVRTAVPPFERMILIDDRVVFVSDHCATADDKPALMITHPSLVAIFSKLYDQQWDRAEPWMGEVRTPNGSITTVRSRRMLKRLWEGASLKSIASELDVSVATLYSDLGKLYEATGTTNQFALGVWYATSQEAAAERALDQ